MYKIYQVEMGETLSSIADKLNTTVDSLKKINGITGDVSLSCKSIEDSDLIFKNATL